MKAPTMDRVDSFHKSSPPRLDSIKILQKDLQNFIRRFQSTKRKIYKFRVRGIPFAESFNNTVKASSQAQVRDPTRGCVSQ